jgi:phosphotransferase system  glucose/maltose/N-acetylglucosamine-specific IIC component
MPSDNNISNKCADSDPHCGDHYYEENVTLDADETFNIIYTVIGVVGLLGNSIVVGVLLSVKRSTHHRRSLTTAFIINQCCSNGASALFIILIIYTRDIHSNYNSLGRDVIHGDTSNLDKEIYCRVWLTNLPVWSMFLASTYNMLMVTYERYTAMVHPKAYHKIFNPNRCVIIIIAVWISATALNAAYMIPTSGMIDHECTVLSNWPSEGAQTAFGILLLLVQYYIPLGLLIYAYNRIIRVLKNEAKGKENSSANNNANSNEDTNETKGEKSSKGSEVPSSIEEGIDAISGISSIYGGKSTHCNIPPSFGGDLGNTNDKEATKSIDGDKVISDAKKDVIKTLAFVSACFVLCWSWNQIYFTMYNFGYAVDFNGKFYHFTVVMVFLNCCLNPLIFAVRYHKFRNRVRKICCREKVDREEGMSLDSLSVLSEINDQLQCQTADSNAALV